MAFADGAGRRVGGSYFKGATRYMMPNGCVFGPQWSSRGHGGLPGDLRVVRDPYIGGVSQAHEWLKPMEAVADRIRSHFDADGLVNEPGKGVFDVYDFQGPDAFSNAATIEPSLHGRCGVAGRALSQAKRYKDDAERINAVYFKTFFNSATGVLAGWKSPMASCTITCFRG